MADAITVAGGDASLQLLREYVGAGDPLAEILDKQDAEAVHDADGDLSDRSLANAMRHLLEGDAGAQMISGDISLSEIDQAKLDGFGGKLYLSSLNDYCCYIQGLTCGNNTISREDQYARGGG